MLFICDGISSGESDSVQDRNNQGWCQVRCSNSSCTNISQRNDTNCAEPSLSAIAVSTRAGSVRRIVMITHLRFSDKLLRTFNDKRGIQGERDRRGRTVQEADKEKRPRDPLPLPVQYDRNHPKSSRLQRI